MAASVRSVGAVVEGGGAITPPLPAGWQVGDILFAFDCRQESQSYIESGWLYFTDFGFGGCYTRVYWQRATAGTTAPTFPTPAFGGQRGVVVAVQDAVTTGTPFIYAAGTNGITTTDEDSLVMLVEVLYFSPAQPGQNWSGWTNANLTGLTEVLDSASASTSMGGAIAIAAGAKATAGATGETTVSPTGVPLTLAVAPGVMPATTVTLTGAMTATALAAIPDSVGEVVVPPTTVTLEGAMTASAVAVIPASVGPVVVTTVTLLGPFGWYPPSEFLPGKSFTTGWQLFWGNQQGNSDLHLKVVLRAEPAAMTATALAPAPGVAAEPLPPIQVPTATATTRAPAPEVHLSILVEAATAVGSGEFPTPTIAGITTFEVESMHVATRFPTPINAGEYGYPNAKTASASARMFAPMRYGPPQPSIYKAMVDRITPAPTVVYHFDDDTGLPLITGDSAGKSLVFDGINDFISPDIPEWVGHTTFVMWFQSDLVVGTDEGLFSDLGQNWDLRIWNDGRINFGGPDQPNPNGIHGPVVQDGQRHMVMVTIEDTPAHAQGVKMFVDGVLAGVGQGGDLRDFSETILGAWQTGFFPNLEPHAFFKGRIDEFAVWLNPASEPGPLQPEWAQELWWQGTGTGGLPTSVTVPIATTSGRAPAPTTAIRLVLDSWQLHDDFLGDDLDPELWIVGYQPQFLMPEGPSGPAPATPLDESPFVLDGEMTLRAGTMVTSRDWFTYGEWVAYIEMEPIPGDSDVVVSIALFAALAEGEGMYEYGAYHNSYEDQFAWQTYVLGPRRYTYRGWGVYSPNFDDSFAYELVPYDPANHWLAIVTSPHSRGGQNVTHYESGDISPGGESGEGYMPYWPMEGPYNNPYEARALRLVIQVSGPPGESITITGINLTQPTTKIAIPTGVLPMDVGAVVARTYPRPYEGVRGTRSIKPPPMRSTVRFLRPPSQAAINAEVMVTIADFRFPEWAGDARPIQVLPVPGRAFASLTPPILFGVPVDVVIDEVALATANGRMLLPGTSGTIKVVFGITRFTARKMATKIEFTKMDLSIGAREMISA